MTAPTSSRTERPYSFGPLYDKLMEIFPDHRSSQGVFSVPAFADDMGVSREAVYRMLRKNKLTPDHVKKILELTKVEGVKREDFLTFIFA